MHALSSTALLKRRKNLWVQGTVQPRDTSMMDVKNVEHIQMCWLSAQATWTWLCVKLQQEEVSITLIGHGRESNEDGT